MATLSLGQCCRIKQAPSNELRNRNNPRVLILLSSQGRGPVNNSTHGEKKDIRGKMILLKLVNGFEKLGKNLKQNLSPQQKGDWKDLLLMSLSFAVYVYISQKLVCAYFAWTSLPKHMW
ncbi:hypothetical protein HN51_045031 [Arachis hypogaea]|uniref:Uncharacterized protein n=1 Tax=Arachis hypogaea TaxID=3818 RepID=A0A444Y1C5_ARAHY|nr:uncharacterized protein DS421_18g626490 [Arachis hypogaea]RYQ95741.1 hypothetical protein Ahy_B08g091084 [Arachis hypogaea]